MVKNSEEEQQTLTIIDLLKEEKYSEVDKIFADMKPYDMVSVFQSIPDRHTGGMLHHLNETTLASMLQKLNSMQQLEMLGKIGPEKANKILSLLDASVLTKLLRKFPKAQLKTFLSEMEGENADYIRKMMGYPENSAGSLMTNRFVSISESLKVKDAIEKIRELALYTESINHLYLVDDRGHLAGTVPYRDLILAKPDELLKNIMLKQVICVTVGTKRDEIVRLLKRYDFTALPVTNDEGLLVGIISFDDMVEAVISEASEDYGKLSTASKEIDFNTKPFVAAYRRLPWLIALLFIGLVSGSIISSFEETLDKVVALAFFMPLIAGMTGNTGTQSLAVVVRGLAENEVNARTVIKLVFREFWVSLMIGVTCGLLISIIAFVWQGNVYLGMVVGSSLFMTLILGTLAGTVIPLLLYKLKMDPAVASGPLITTVNDIFSLIVYFSIATHFISKLT